MPVRGIVYLPNYEAVPALHRFPYSTLAIKDHKTNLPLVPTLCTDHGLCDTLLELELGNIHPSPLKVHYGLSNGFL